MKRFAFWLRWSWRDLRSRWLLVVAIAATIAIGTGAYAALDSMTTWRVQSTSASLATLDAHDVRLTLANGSYARTGSLVELARTIPHAGLIRASAERVVVQTRVDASVNGRTILVPGQLIGMPVGDPGVDRLDVEGGRGLQAGDAGAPVAVLEDHFARHYALEMPMTITLADGAPVQAIGRAMSPEYLIVMAPDGGIMAEANFAVVFMSTESAAASAGRPGMVNDLVVRLSNPADAALIRDELQKAATARFPELGPTVTLGADEDARRMIVQDASSDGTFFGMFAVILLGGAAFAAFNLTSRIVESQRRQIGIGLALGVSPRTLAVRPLAVSAEIALLGIALGILFGLGFGALLRGVLVDMLPMPVFDSSFQLDVFARAAAIGFILPFAASLYPVWRAVRTRPVDAIRTGYLSARRPGLVRLASRLRLPGSTFIQVPVRNVLRTPRRTLLTSLGIAASITVSVGVLGMLDTLSGGVDRLDAELTGTTPQRLEVFLAAPAQDTAVRSLLASVPGAARVDAGLRLPATGTASGKSIHLTIDVQPLTDNVWRPALSAGRLPAGPGEVLLSAKAAQDLGLRPGDSFTLRHPQRTSETAVATAESRVTLTGTVDSVNQPGAYLDPSAAASFGFDGLVNRATVVPAAGVSMDDLQRAVFQLPGVVTAQPIDSLVTSMRDLVVQFTDILGIAAFISLLLALLVAYNSASIGQDERSREIATMLAFGLPVRRVMGMAMIESGLTGVVGTLLGIVAGLATLYWLVFGLLPSTMPEFAIEPALAPGTLLLAAALGIVLVGLSPLLTIRRLLRMNLPATLRVVE